jgi:iron complex transport system ATP-binding protein
MNTETGVLGVLPGIIVIRHLTVRFQDRVALLGVSAEVPAGVLTAVVGACGSGKSTLLKALACELSHSEGTVWIEDVPARLWPRGKKLVCVAACPRRISIPAGAPPDGHSACDDMPCGATVNVPLEALRLFGTVHLAGRRCASLNSRDRRRVELAATVAPFLDPRPSGGHLWLDDPLDGIDPLHQHRFLNWLRETAAQRRSTIIATVDHALPRLYADHVILLRDGQVVGEGSPKEALSPGNLTAAYGAA